MVSVLYRNVQKKLVLVVSTFPSEKDAEKICLEAVEKRHAACANLFKARSIFTWEGRTERVEETLALIKTSKDAHERLTHFIKAKHPYSTPEILVLDVQDVNRDYLDWVITSTKGS